MKKITIKSSVLATAVVMTIGVGDKSYANVFEQLAAVANSALPTYGREQALSYRPDLDRQQIEAGLREALRIGSDRVVEIVTSQSGYSADEESRLSADLRRAQKTAAKLGHEASFELLHQQIDETILAAAPATGELLKAAVERVELIEPQKLLFSYDTAATDFLRHKVSGTLQRQMRPLVLELLQRTGAASTSTKLGFEIQFGDLLDTITSDYVIQQSIDGFFNQLEIQETSIRHNPESRTTALIKQVFQ